MRATAMVMKLLLALLQLQLIDAADGGITTARNHVGKPHLVFILADE